MQYNITPEIRKMVTQLKRLKASGDKWQALDAYKYDDKIEAIHDKYINLIFDIAEAIGIDSEADKDCQMFGTPAVIEMMFGLD